MFLEKWNYHFCLQNPILMSWHVEFIFGNFPLLLIIRKFDLIYSFNTFAVHKSDSLLFYSLSIFIIRIFLFSESVPHLESWQESLTQCANTSQLFVHLGTLERSVAWSRSVLKAHCRICRRRGDAENMLLCDGCNRGHHIYCLKPPLKVIFELYNY